MYDFQIHRDTTASPAELWRIYTEVAGWPRWNKAISEAHLDGDFATGGKGRFTVAFALALQYGFHLENVEPMKRWDMVWKVGPLVSTTITHVIEQTASGARFTHGFHAGGVLAVAELQSSWAAKAHIPGTMALLADIAEGRST